MYLDGTAISYQIMSSSLRTLMRSALCSAAASAAQQTQQHRCLSNLARTLTSASRLPPSRHSPSTCFPASLSLASSSAVRHHSTLPVQQHYIPRRYPFPLILTTELLAEEDFELHPANPHDLPPYKSTLVCNIHDLPLTAAEKRVFRLLVGPRIYSHTFHPHPVPSFLTARSTPHIPHHRRQRAKDSAVRVRFVSRHLSSAQANENRVFQLLDECIRVSKQLVAEMAVDGQWVEEGEDEAMIREAMERLRAVKREERGVKEGGEAVEEQQAQMIGGESAGGRAAERLRVSREVGGHTNDGAGRE